MKLTYRSTLYACWLGYVTQAISVNLATLFFVIFRDDFGLTYTEIGSLVLITFIIQILVDGIMIKLTSVIGYRAAAVAAHIFTVVGLVCLGTLPFLMNPFWGILISVFFYSIGGGMTEVVISPIVDSLPGEAKASGMCLLHSFYSWGMMLVVIVTTVILKIVGNGLWMIIPFVWTLIPLFNTFLFIKAPIPQINPEAVKTPLKVYFKSPIMYAAIIMMICAGASEMAMAQWASLFAESGLGVSKILGDLLGPCLFALNMGIGRTVYGLFGEKINIKAAIIICSVFTMMCYLLTVFAGFAFLSLLGCALCGFGVSLMWPGILSMTSESFGMISGPALFACLALAGDVGCSLGPWITGRVSDLYISINSSAQSGSSALRFGLLVASVFPLIMIITSLVMFFSKKSKKIISNK